MGFFEPSKLPLICCQVPSQSRISRIQFYGLGQVNVGLTEIALHPENTSKTGEERGILWRRFDSLPQLVFGALEISPLRKLHSSLRMLLRGGRPLTRQGRDTYGQCEGEKK